MAELKALIFDVDGTLADTERDGHRVAFNQAFKQAGLDWEWSVELYDDLLSVTGGKERIRFFLEKYQPDFQPEEGITAFAARIHKHKTAHYLSLLQSGRIPLRTGVERLLQAARAHGLSLGIATTTTPENVTYLLKATLGEASLAWFDVIAAGDIVPAKKPAADIYEYALKQMNLTAEECLAFEDSYNGLQSSLGANLHTLVTTNTYTYTHDFTGAALVINNLGTPETPFQVLQGNNHQQNHVNIELLQRIHQDS